MREDGVVHYAPPDSSWTLQHAISWVQPSAPFAEAAMRVVAAGGGCSAVRGAAFASPFLMALSSRRSMTNAMTVMPVPSNVRSSQR